MSIKGFGYLEHLLVKNGKFISATDVAINGGNNEFFGSESILSFLLNYGSISNVSEIHSSNGSKLLKSTKISKQYKSFEDIFFSKKRFQIYYFNIFDSC